MACCLTTKIPHACPTVNYIIDLKKCTCLVVSHDTKFLDNVCTNIIHYENLKLKTYKGNLSDFVKQKPEAKAYYELSSDLVAFKFPDPGHLPPPVLAFHDVSFGYPGCEILYDNVNFGVDLDSRVALVGPNGAGKSTFLNIVANLLW